MRTIPRTHSPRHARRLPRHRCDACRVSGARTAVTWLGARKVQVCAHLLFGKPGPAVSR